MKIDKHFRRAFLAALAGAVSLATAQAAVDVLTLGGGPSSFRPSKAGFIDGNTYDAAKFNQPYGIAVHPDGYLVVADRKNNAIRGISAPGSDADSETGTLGPRIRHVVAVAVDGDGLLYSASQRDGTVYVQTPLGSVLNSFTGFVQPTALAVDSALNIYVAESTGDIRMIAAGGGVVDIATGFAHPAGMVLVNDTTLAVTDSESHGIYSVDVNTGTVTTIAGANGQGYVDGPAESAKFNSPHGIALAADGTLVVADRFNHRVRLVSTDGLVETLYGNSKTSWPRPYAGWRDGSRVNARAREPIGVAIGTNGTVYVTELYWNLVRQVTGAPFYTGPDDDDDTNEVSLTSSSF